MVLYILTNYAIYKNKKLLYTLFIFETIIYSNL